MLVDKGEIQKVTLFIQKRIAKSWISDERCVGKCF